MKYVMLLLLLPACSFGQHNDSLHTAIIKLNLTAPLDAGTFPTLEFAYEKQVGKQISIQGEAGYQLYSFYKEDTSFVHPGGFKAKVEFRYYKRNYQHGFDVPRQTDLTGLYFGANVFYRQSKDNRALFYSHQNDTATRRDYFYANKKIWGFNALIGYQLNKGKKMVLDFYAGLGAMHRTAKEHNLNYNDKLDILTTAIGVNVYNSLNDSYLSKNNGWMGSVTLGIRLGLRL